MPTSWTSISDVGIRAVPNCNVQNVFCTNIARSERSQLLSSPVLQVLNRRLRSPLVNKNRAVWKPLSHAAKPHICNSSSLTLHTISAGDRHYKLRYIRSGGRKPTSGIWYDFSMLTIRNCNWWPFLNLTLGFHVGTRDRMSTAR
jgi:hypothetical protein